MKNILIIEDDILLNKGVTFALKKEGYNVLSSFNYEEGIKNIENNNIDFLLLDINLPDKSGLELCKEISNKVNFPIVFFTANDTEEDMLRGFECGCDDYLAKPFSIEVLKHKIKIMLKNKPTNDENIFEYKDLKINFDKMNVLMNNQEINLTTTEYKLLELLIKNHKKVITKEMLLAKLWDNSGNYVDNNTLNVNIRRLRKKIEKDTKNPEYINTVFGIGYTFGE